MSEENLALRQLVQSEGDGETFEYDGYKCEILRMKETLHLCGYVTVPKHHNAVNNFFSFNDEGQTGYWNIDVSVHGGLTFGRYDKEKEELTLGFDCAHSGDICPGYQTATWFPGSTYKNIDYVRGEIKQLVNQLKTLPLCEHAKLKQDRQELIEVLKFYAFPKGLGVSDGVYFRSHLFDRDVEPNEIHCGDKIFWDGKRAREVLKKMGATG